MRILVTGVAGYVGVPLAQALVGRGHEVIGLDNLAVGGRALLPLLASDSFTFCRADVRDDAAVQHAARGCEFVVHLAAIVGAPACARAPRLAREVNVNGSAVVAAAARACQGVIYASTGSVYGSTASAQVNELTTVRPSSVYADTKYRAEEIFLRKTHAAVLRFATAYGVAPRFRPELLVNHLVDLAVNVGHIELYQPGARRSFLHVRDIARALVLAVERFPEMRGEVFNVGDVCQTMTKADLCARIAAGVGDVAIELEEGPVDPDRRDHQMSFEKIEALDFRASRTMAAGIRELARLFRYLPKARGAGAAPDPTVARA